jgi:hypothetical protein
MANLASGGQAAGVVPAASDCFLLSSSPRPHTRGCFLLFVRAEPSSSLMISGRGNGPVAGPFAMSTGLSRPRPGPPTAVRRPLSREVISTSLWTSRASGSVDGAVAGTVRAGFNVRPSSSSQVLSWRQPAHRARAWRSCLPCPAPPPAFSADDVDRVHAGSAALFTGGSPDRSLGPAFTSSRSPPPRASRVLCSGCSGIRLHYAPRSSHPPGMSRRRARRGRRGRRNNPEIDADTAEVVADLGTSNRRPSRTLGSTRLRPALMQGLHRLQMRSPFLRLVTPCCWG